jgi:hypothetical protein
MDGSKEQPKTTAGLDLGDKYSYLCLIETHSGEVIEEGRLPTSPRGFQTTLRLRAASYAHRHRNGNPLALG